MYASFGTSARYKEQYDFDVFNLLITALKESGYRKYQYIVDYCHVLKAKDSDEMTDLIETNIYLSEYIKLKEMETRLRYDRDFLEHCLENMEDYTYGMLERDTKFWQEVRQHKARVIMDIRDYIRDVRSSGEKICKKKFADSKGYKYDEVLKFWQEAEEVV